MKKRIPSFLLGVATTVLVFTLSISALAATGAINLDVYPIDVLVNNEMFHPKNVNGEDVLVFVYDGTTYAPLRALAEAYGLEVGYDSAQKLASVSKPGTTPIIPTSNKRLHEMTYEEFRDTLVLLYESGNKLEAPRETGIQHYHFTLSADYIISDGDFMAEWNEFLENGNGKEYLNKLRHEYGERVPYNEPTITIQRGGKQIFAKAFDMT